MKPRLIFFGTPEFGIPSLNLLYNNGFQIHSIYTLDLKSRNRAIRKSPVYNWAKEKKIQVFTPFTLKDEEIVKNIHNANPDVIIVASYGNILPKSILQIPKLGCLNLHPSLLPLWRGSAPIQRSILNGDKETGITIILMNEELDAGPILSQKIIQANRDYSFNDLYVKLSLFGADLLVDTLEKFLEFKIEPKNQDHKNATLAKKIYPDEGRLIWKDSAYLLERKVRALNPWPGTWFNYNNERIKVLKAEVIPLDFVNNTPGLIIDNHLTVACGINGLRILKIQKPGGKVLDTKSFLNGYILKKGIRLESE